MLAQGFTRPLRTVLILAAAWSMPACAAPEDVLLARIRVVMAEALRRMPDYTCLETIERWCQGDPCPQCRYWERLRLEVAVIGGRERFAWPDAGRFEDKEIDQILPPGASGTGDFSGFATAIFRTDAAQFEGPFPDSDQGRPAWRYLYRVPQPRSRYTVRDGRHAAVVGYHGAFWVDRDSLELLRLTIEADGLPQPPLEVTAARTTISYQKVRIGDGEFLLPQVSELTLSSLSVPLSRNRTTFSQCRQYVGRATVRFDDQPPETTPSRESPVAVELPPGLNIELSLETPFDPAHSAAGDPIVAVVAREVRRGGRVVAPKGARVEGRLRTVRQHVAPRTIGVLGLAFERLRTPGFEAPFRARLELLGGLLAGVRRPTDVVVSETRKESVILFNGPLVRLPRGWRTQWRTLP